MKVERSIFKAYDIRGIYPSEINGEIAYAIARGYASVLMEHAPRESLRIAVGRDMRVSSEELNQQFIRGLLDSGIDVDDIGIISTPTFYFATAYYGYDGGALISASHNPKEWNGFKMVGRHSSPMSFDNALHKVLDAVEKDILPPLVSESERGKLQNREGALDIAIKDQFETLGINPSKIKPFKIAIDIANGMAGGDMKAFFSKIPSTILWMNETPDGTFPAHPADPMKEENTVDLRRKIVEEKCDFGIASDGDGDRYFLFDEKGEVVPQEILRGLMAQIELRIFPGATVVYDIRPGKITRDLIDDAGGRAIVAPVGHSLIKEKMIAEKAVFGGESSGHYFYKLPYGTFEAPFILLYRFLTFLSEHGKPLSEVIKPYKIYFNSGEINTKLESREAGLHKIEQIKEKYKNGSQSVIDGLSVTLPEYWFNVRLSNTEPMIRVTIEGTYKEIMEQKRDELLALIRS